MSYCNDHQQCIEEALTNAKAICSKADMRFTALREQVFKLIWQTHKPIGAYELLDQLAESSTRRIAPPTVYRALEFLLDAGLIHRINALNAYIGCNSPTHNHPSYFFICTKCHTASECNSPQLNQQVSTVADEQDFTIDTQWLEVLGICADCKNTGTH